MKRLDKTEIVFKVFSYVLLTIFAIACLYPLIYVLAVAFSSTAAYENTTITIVPMIGTTKDDIHFGFQFDAFKNVVENKRFWLYYCNTLFYTFYGTIVSMFVGITGAYALSKSRLMFGRGFNFLLTFTMWFSAGIVATYQNFVNLGINNKWGFIFGLGFNAYNIILLRNGFSGVPSEIEEAATIDGATEFQLLTKIYMPMTKSTIATVTMFYALSRWNGYYWAAQLLSNNDIPLQVYMRNMLESLANDESASSEFDIYPAAALQFAMIVCSIIPIIILYPMMQRYFAAGVNLGGVKE